MKLQDLEKELKEKQHEQNYMVEKINQEEELNSDFMQRTNGKLLNNSKDAINFRKHISNQQKLTKEISNSI